jgi:hypothetical protein
MELRMYFFVPYNISEIQKGIQAGHAAIRYVIEYGRTQEFKDWYINNKTWIILNGGTTRYFREESDLENGTLNKIADELSLNNINNSVFHEPDLNYALTAICFIADERVWNKEKYPDFDDYVKDKDIYLDDLHSNWADFIGGKKNLFLRELLKDKHLA